MSLIQSFKHVIAPPHKAGLPFILGGLGAAFIARLLPSCIGKPLSRASLAFSGFSLYFFRNPERSMPCERKGKELIVSAADGHIVSIEKVSPPEGIGMRSEPVWRIATFLSVLDVHLNRAPVSGEITGHKYIPGKFFNASLDKASEHNERNALCITTNSGKQVGLVQIAGLIARRIVCDVKVGDRVQQGDLYGLIRFGSRTDVYLPAGVEPRVTVGQTMVGGETILALMDR